jgi:ribosomal protein S18 acetylase RimI-like enzyme
VGAHSWRRGRGAERILVRTLETRDLEPLFGTRGRYDGANWLARQRRGELVVAVAEAGGAPIGKMCLDLISLAEERVGYVFAAGVAPEWRSRGVGALLGDYVARAARAQGLVALRCDVAKQNPRSLSWCERRGYRRIGEGVVSWIENGDREVEADCWTLERPLRRAWLARLRRTLSS